MCVCVWCWGTVPWWAVPSAALLSSFQSGKQTSILTYMNTDWKKEFWDSSAAAVCDEEQFDGDSLDHLSISSYFSSVLSLYQLLKKIFGCSNAKCLQKFTSWVLTLSVWPLVPRWESTLESSCAFSMKRTLWEQLEGTKMVELSYVKPRGAADAEDDSP